MSEKIGNKFFIGSAIVTLVFLLTRLPFFIYYPVTSISFDSASYCAVAFNILDLNLPSFEVRTPGYPLFLAAIWFISKNLYCISLMQSIFTLFSTIFFLWVINKFYRDLLLYFAAAVTIYISSSYFILLETALLTEGLFVDLLILCCAFLILALKENKMSGWAMFSLTVAITIIVRPAGLFLLSIIFLLIVYFIIRKYKLKIYAWLIVPFTSLILGLCLYNYITLNSFTITPFGESNLSGVAITFMEPSPEYPPHVNEAIDSVIAAIPHKDISYVKNTFGQKKLYEIFLNNYVLLIPLTDYLVSHDSGLTYTDVQPMLRRIYTDAIMKYPLVYCKFFLVNFYQYIANIGISMRYFDELSDTYKEIFIDKRYVMKLEGGGWQQVSSNEADYVKVKDFYLEEINGSAFSYIRTSENQEVELERTFLKSTYEIYEKVYNVLFRNLFWMFLFVITFLVSLYRIFKSRFSDINAVIFFLLGMMFISKAVMVSMVEISLLRYSYPVEFVYYLSLPYLLLFVRSRNKNGK